MKRRLVLASGFALLLAGAFQLASQLDQTVPEAENHRPARIPDRVILTWSGDPATTQSVTWRTSTDVRGAVAEIALAEDGPLFVKKAKQVRAADENLKTDLSEAAYHSATFTELQPDTQYCYRVGDGYNWSEWNQFRTASRGPAPLEFLYVGDAQNDIWEMWSRLIRQGYTEAPKTRFIVHAGDLINRAGRDAEWGEWHRAAGWINRSVPSFPTPGNHEYGLAGKKITSNWTPQFTLPGNGVPGLEETNYWLDIQGVRMIALNSNVKQKEQAEWLDQLLASNPNQWTILTFHHPIFSTAKARDNKELRELWQPVFDKHGVDLVLTGHDHSYGRTNMISGTSTQAGKSGTVYAVSVSGPKMYNLQGNPKMVRSAEDTQLFQIVRVNRDRLEYEARTARGVLYDAFELRKSRGRKQMINKMPSTPENRRQTTD